jgi:hypothetical protein
MKKDKDECDRCKNKPDCNCKCHCEMVICDQRHLSECEHCNQLEPKEDNREKLKAIIEKAIKNGWTFDGYDFDADWREINWIEIQNDVLFSHKFAKAYFGEEEFTRNERLDLHVQYNWQYHLQQAVISDEVIDYYYKSL